MPQALQVFANKPQTSDFGAGASPARDTESGENQGFSRVLDDKVSQARETSRASESRSADTPATQTAVKNKGNDLQGTATNGKSLPQQTTEAGEPVLPPDAAITALTDPGINTADADVLMSAADGGSAVDEPSGQVEVDAGIADIAPVILNTAETPDSAHIPGSDDLVADAAAAPVPAGTELSAPGTPAAIAASEQRTSGDVQIAGRSGQSGPVASLVAAKIQTDISRQAQTAGDETGTDSVLVSENHQDEVLSAKQQAGEFSTKLRGLIDQVKRALGVGQGTTASAAGNQSNSLSTQHGTAPLVTAAPQAGDISPAQNTATAAINTGLKQEGWDEAMGQRVQWMVSKGIQKADIRLNPPNLGPLEVRINMTDDGADVRFISQHSVVRDSVESAMPRLREMLAEQGIDLANVDVSGHSVAHGDAHQDGERQGTGENGQGLAAHANGEHDDETQLVTSRVSQGMLDLFA